MQFAASAGYNQKYWKNMPFLEENMAKRNANPPVYEENAGSNRLTKVLCAVALYGIALLLAYIAVAPPQSGTAMAAIRGVLTGLAGHLAVVIPLFLGWIATLTALSAAGASVPSRASSCA